MRPLDHRAMLERCHALALAAAAGVTPRPQAAGRPAAGLTPQELEKLSGASPRLLMAMSRAVAWL